MHIIKFALDSVAFSCLFKWANRLKSAWITAISFREHSYGCFAPSFIEIGHNVQKLHSYQWSAIAKQIWNIISFSLYTTQSSQF